MTSPTDSDYENEYVTLPDHSPRMWERRNAILPILNIPNDSDSDTESEIDWINSRLDENESQQRQLIQDPLLYNRDTSESSEDAEQNTQNVDEYFEEGDWYINSSPPHQEL